MPISNKLLLIFLAISLLPASIIGTLGFYDAKGALMHNTVTSLRLFAESKENEILLLIEKLKTNARDFASDGFIRDSAEQMIGGTDEMSQSTTRLNDHLLRNKLPLNPDLAYIDVLNADGVVVASTHAEGVGQDMSRSDYFIQGLQRIYISGVHPRREGGIEIDISTPLTARGHAQKIIGVLINHYKLNAIHQLLRGELDLGQVSGQGGLGETGETYLIGKNQVLLAGSRFADSVQFGQQMDTHPVRMWAQSRQETNGAWINYRGVPVVGASMMLDLGGEAWLLLTEQEEAEAFSQIYALRKTVVLICLLLLAIVVAVAIYMARTLTRPIRQMTRSVDEITRGNLDSRVVGSFGNDEIGFLARAFNQMTENLQQSRQRLEALAVQDGLTGLYNRRRLEELLMYEFNRAARYHLELCCLMLDVDHFKKVNDTYGHLFGDYVLKGVSDLITRHSRKTDIVGRYGGEEFVLIIPSASSAEAVALAEKLRRAIGDHAFCHEGFACPVTVSVGIAVYREEMGDYQDLIRCADLALYEAKGAGRNRCRLWQGGVEAVSN